MTARRGPQPFDHSRLRYVYLHIDAAGRALYAGCTVNPAARAMHHRYTAAWWPQVDDTAVIGPFERDAALEIERELIGELQPLFNVRSNPAIPHHSLGRRVSA